MLIISLFAHLQACLVRYQTRAALKQLSPQQVKDVGLSAEQHRQEAAKSNLVTLVRELCSQPRQRSDKL